MKYFLLVCFGSVENENKEMVRVQSIVLVESETYESAIEKVQKTREENQLPLFDEFMNATLH